jgi:hypothetical protein
MGLSAHATGFSAREHRFARSSDTNCSSDADAGPSFTERPGEVAETRRPDASDQHQLPFVDARQFAGAPHRAVAVHVGDHDDQIGPRDQRFEAALAGACEVPGVTFERMPGFASQLFVAP